MLKLTSEQTKTARGRKLLQVIIPQRNAHYRYRFFPYLQVCANDEILKKILFFLIAFQKSFSMMLQRII